MNVPFLSSRELLYAQILALVLADEFRSPTIELVHLLGGLYLKCPERLSKYWSDAARFDEFFRVECQLDEPHWFYWIRAYESLYTRKRTSRIRERKPQSQELLAVYSKAAESAKLVADVNTEGGTILLPEDILYAIATQEDLTMRASLVQSGLNLQALEEAMRTRQRTTD